MKTLEEIRKEYYEKRMNKLAFMGDAGSEFKDNLWSWITDNFVPKSTISQTKQELIEECICNEWDGKGISTCGFPCPVHNKNARDNRIHKEGFDAGYIKGYKDGLKNVSGWSKQYEKMMLENL